MRFLNIIQKLNGMDYKKLVAERKFFNACELLDLNVAN